MRLVIMLYLPLVGLGKASGSGSVLCREASVPWPSCAYDPDSMGLCLSESEDIKEQCLGPPQIPERFPK